MKFPLRDHLVELLSAGAAHADFDKAVADFPEKLRGVRPPHSPHTGWRLVEHMRITQADILAFSRDARHESPKWPEGYWPTGDAPPRSGDWDDTIRAFRRDRDALIEMVNDPKADLLVPFPHGRGQTLAREAMLAADHAAYHVGQLILVRQVLGCRTN
jgi:hypothetical protein